MKPTHLAAALAIGLTTSLTACSGSGDSGTAAQQQSVGAVRGDGKTITVWVMNEDYSTETLTAINDEFTAQTGARVNLQVQDWDGITTKITTALATSTPPDVLDLGNTQVAAFAANGGLKDLSPYADDLRQGQTWLGGLVDPATVDGQLYAVPGFAGARAVIYNKKIWAAAGVTAPPTTHEELRSALDKVRAANPAADFSPLYLPGQNWYAGMQFVWDAGGEIATNEGGKWSGGFSSAKAQQGLSDFKEFQNRYSAPASRTVDTKSPDQLQIFADGKASAVIATSGALGQIQKANPALTEADLGSFPLPGKSGRTQPVMLGGSDWGVAAKSQNADLAVAWVKIAASPKVQSTWVLGKEGWIPNSTEEIRGAGDVVKPAKMGFFTAALNSKATPASPNWAEIEGKKDLEALFAAVASGSKSPKDAAAAFDTAAAKVLNAST